MLEQIRKKKVLKRIGELHSLGMSLESIRQTIADEFKFRPAKATISSIIKKFQVISKEIFTDEEIRGAYMELVSEMISKLKENLKHLDITRKIILDKLEQAKGFEQTREVKLLEQYVFDIKNTQDWVVIANKINEILKLIKSPSFTDNFQLLTYIREVNSGVRAQNDTVKSMSEMLKRLEAQSKETKLTTTVQVTRDTLKELENAGMIKILKNYDNITDEESKNEEEVENETN
jgi:hypothetical protein